MSAADWTTIDQPQDIRLVVADMDGTLLDEHGRIPEGFWDMLARLRAASNSCRLPAASTPRCATCSLRRRPKC